MANKGFISSAAAFIRQVRHNLSEGRYALGESGFAIIKELVQNADDAGAKVLQIGFGEPLAGAKHRLLQAPGFFVINNGRFERRDAENIRRFGENSKAIDAAKIGKYGLGLKSVFHLCEAFFFGAIHGGDIGKYFVDILNPWSSGQDDDFHPDWDDIDSTDKQLLAQMLRPFCKGDTCFFLWLPLRQREMLGGDDPICQYYPGDDSPAWMTESHLPCEVAKLLPMLTGLRSVQGWEIANGKAALTFDVSLADHSQRRVLFDELTAGMPKHFGGFVATSHFRTALKTSIEFVGIEINPHDGKLVELENDKQHWPSDLGRDPESGRPKKIREKARQHAGVSLTASRMPEGRNGNLSISWAVFLPLGEPERHALSGSSVDVVLLLHGYFFVDAGRNKVVGLHDKIGDGRVLADDEQLRHTWNRRLAEIGTLPLVPSALAQLASGRDSSLQYDDVAAVTEALRRSSLYSEFRNHLCRDHGWAALLEPGGKRKWILFSSAAKVVEMPFCSDSSLPRHVFPAIDELADQYKITIRSSPRLTHSASEVSWPTPAIQRLLDSVVSQEILLHPQSAHYLADFFDLLAEQQSLQGCASTLARIMRRALAETGIAWTRERSAHVRRLLAQLPPQLRLPLNFGGEIGDLLFRELSRQDVELVFVPHELDSIDSPGSARLDKEQAIAIFKSLTLRQLQSNDLDEQEAISVLSAELLHRVHDQAEVRQGIAGFKLFVAKSCRDRTDKLTTLSDLERHRMDKTLFVSPSPRAYTLQKALAEETVLIISGNCFKALFTGDASQCTPLLILETLGRSSPPTLATTTTRFDLLKELRDFKTEPRQAAAHRMCVRYLLHGEPLQFQSQAPLLLANFGASDVWRRITLISLESQNSNWRLIDPEFARLLTDEHKTLFALEEIGPRSAMHLLRQAEPIAFANLKPSPTEYSALLAEIDDDELCRKMLIHEDLSGRFTEIKERCYWESEVSIPAGLQHSVTILRKSTREATWRRQRELASQLDAIALIEIVLNQAEPGRFWTVIVNSLARELNLDRNLWLALRSTAWLPTQDGNFIRPENVIDLPKIADDVARTTAAVPGIFVEPGMLHCDLRGHASYEVLQQHAFPNIDKALSMLGMLLIENPTNHVGPIDRDRFPRWLELAGEMPADLLPCGNLVHITAEQYPSAAGQIFDQLVKPPISCERIQAFLDYLRLAHRREPNSKRKATILVIFREYLKQIVAREGDISRFAEQELPNLVGNWRSARDLCYDFEGIAKDHLIDDETAAALGFVATSPAEKAAARDAAATAMTPELQDIEALVGGYVNASGDLVASLGKWRKYWESAADGIAKFFERWKGLVSDEEIGGFLSILGDDPRVCELAQKFLGRNRTLHQTRVSLGADFDFTNKRVIVGISYGPLVAVRNLFGDLREMQKLQHATTLFVGFGSKRNPFPKITALGKELIGLCLTEVPLERGELDLSRLLRDSTARLLTLGYGCIRSPEFVAQCWESLGQSDQLDIRIAQERVVENGFLILAQLGLRSVSQIDAVLDAWDAAQRLSAERNSRRPFTGGSKNAGDGMRYAKDRLRSLLENDVEVHARIVDAIRRRIAEYYQYTKAAVPFEIFQNADDASVELIEHFDLSDEQRQNAEAFHVVSTPTQVTLAHFGRRINQYPSETTPGSSGFDNDLWKMLVLSLSNKSQSCQDDIPTVTGKFGLGFKSSYLVSKAPRLLSGRLAFEVTGGMYPRRLLGEERSSLDNVRTALPGRDSHITILQLPLTDATEDEVMSDFRRLAHIAVVFARRIRYCIFNGGDMEVKWQPTPVPGVERSQTGTVTPLPTGIAPPEGPIKTLLLNTDFGSVLFALNVRGFDAFPDDLPTIWVTAPTRDTLKLGFLINGPFALDVGRAELARDFSHHRELAVQFGQAVAAQLGQLFQLTTHADGWSGLRTALHLAYDADSYDFWDSFFERIGNAVAARPSTDGSADTLVRQIFWGDHDGGATLLYRTHESLPTRLRGSYRTLVSVSQCRHALVGFLEEDAELFGVMSHWDSFREHAPPGSVVSYKHILQTLRQLAGEMVSHVRMLSASTVLSWEFKQGSYADAPTAKRLGTVITKRTLDQIKDHAERNELRAMLEAVDFKGKDNRYHPAAELLLGHASDLDRDDRRDDERFRTKFAPDDRVLSEDYQGTAIAFFDVCRGILEAPVKLMADWVLEAADLVRRMSALDYLAHGRLRTELVAELKRRGFAGTWLAGLATSDAFRLLNDPTRAKLLDLLPDNVRPDIDWDGLLDQPPTRVSGNSEHTLLAIHEWWCNNRQRPQADFEGRSYLEEYEYRTYPAGTLPLHLNSDGPEADAASRKDWMSLFILGLVHTMGGFQREQHRSFLTFCERNGSLSVFSSRETEAEEWIAVLEKYFEAQIDSSPFLHWMRQFVGIFAISRRLDDYAELFLSIARQTSAFPLTVITEPATSQLAPVAAPSISRVLGMGACFVVRELLRMGVLANKYAHRHAFVPVKGVRELFKQIGWDGREQSSRKWELSADLYAFAVKYIGPEKAVFCNDFDIPFQFLREDSRLQMQLLREPVQSRYDGEDDLTDEF